LLLLSCRQVHLLGLILAIYTLLFVFLMFFFSLLIFPHVPLLLRLRPLLLLLRRRRLLLLRMLLPLLLLGGVAHLDWAPGLLNGACIHGHLLPEAPICRLLWRACRRHRRQRLLLPQARRGNLQPPLVAQSLEQAAQLLGIGGGEQLLH
jgi:hypothetical protein